VTVQNIYFLTGQRAIHKPESGEASQNRRYQCSSCFRQVWKWE